MKKINIAFVFGALALSACTLIPTSKETLKAVADELPINDKVTLYVMNMEDYIYSEDTDGDTPAFCKEFIEWAEENTKFKNIEVIYDTTDTNETLLTQLQTGKVHYDLICPSDYMIQKMAREDLIQKLDKRGTLLPNYDQYASRYIRNRLDEIPCQDGNGNDATVGEYAVGYMWGTLGILFNPDYKGYDYDTLIQSMQHWHALYDKSYSGTISIKDSMRDTYAAVLMEVYKEDLLAARNQWENDEINDDEYHQAIQTIFDMVDDETIKKVGSSLATLKGNIYGLEVDSGKSDIVQGRIGINLAWSGDAIYSMELGEENDVSLLYSVPLNGSNIWFDAWVMPKNTSRSSEVEELAYLFLDYLSTPENAVKNVESTGYTSFIGGDEMLDLMRSWYDDRYDEEGELLPDVDVSELTPVDLNYFFNPSYSSDSSFVPSEDYIFYTEEYLVDFTYEDENGEERDNEAVGGAFFCQYPDEKTITRCAVMKDYGDQNSKVLKMWEKFKSSNLPSWAYVLFFAELIFFVGLALFLIINKRLKYRLRVLRKKQISKN